MEFRFFAGNFAAGYMTGPRSGHEYVTAPHMRRLGYSKPHMFLLFECIYLWHELFFFSFLFETYENQFIAKGTRPRQAKSGAQKPQPRDRLFGMNS
jgi:hypothetical protein